MSALVPPSATPTTPTLASEPSTALPKALPSSTCGGFFVIDSRAWERVCAIGANAALAYLVLAAFTARDHRTTSASVNSFGTYIGLKRARAEQTMEGLKEAGLVIDIGEGKRQLVPAHQVPGCEGAPPPPLKPVEQMLYDRLLAGERTLRHGRCPRLRHNRPDEVAEQLITKGWARKLLDGAVEPIVYDPVEAAKPQWIWLPTALVRGVAGGRPLQQLHESGDRAAVHLLVRLYAEQDLPSDGGIHWSAVRWRYRKVKVDERGKHDICVFYNPKLELNPHHPAFVRSIPYLDDATDDDRLVQQLIHRIEQLRRLGFLDVVGHVVTAANEDGEVLHPCSARDGADKERAVMTAATSAANALIKSDRRFLVYGRFGSDALLLPVDRTMRQAELLDLVRLRYRPHTKSIKAWYAQMLDTCARYEAKYKALRAKQGAGALVT